MEEFDFSGIKAKIFPIGKGMGKAIYPVNLPMESIVGGKGANLVRLAKKYNVPQGFILPTYLTSRYTHTITKANEDILRSLISKGLDNLATVTYGVYLVSVRSGAYKSMPGMMDTVLNIGINHDNIKDWEKVLGEWTAWDAFRRLYQLYGTVVYGIDSSVFERSITYIKTISGITDDTQLTVHNLKSLVSIYKEIYSNFGKVLPNTIEQQVFEATVAVFKSWNSARAKSYRALHGYPSSWGTAVTVQRMVLGNLNDNSCTGVLFTRDPATGGNEITGEYLVNAQGEDVVAGIRTPLPLAQMFSWNVEVATELVNTVCELEDTFKEVQDVEFTVEDGELFLLQTRNAKRSPRADLKIRMDMIDEGLKEIGSIKELLTPSILLAQTTDYISENSKPPIITGIGAGGGAMRGLVAKSKSDLGMLGTLIFLAEETTPNDIDMIAGCQGVLTSTGGLTSHASVVARGLGKTCVVGAEGLDIQAIPSGTPIVIDGNTGKVWLDQGHVNIISGELNSGIVETLKEYKRGSLIGARWTDSTTIYDIKSWLKLVKDLEAGGVLYIKELLGGNHQEQFFESLTDTIKESGVKLIVALEKERKDRFILNPTTAINEVEALLNRFKGVAEVMEFTNIEVKTVSDLLKSSLVKDISDEVVEKVFGSREVVNTLLETLSINCSSSEVSDWFAIEQE